MSFGTSVSDVFYIIGLTKRIVQDARWAPAGFYEVLKTVESLNILLESLEAEVQSPTSVFRRDTIQGEHFCTLVGPRIQRKGHSVHPKIHAWKLLEVPVCKSCHGLLPVLKQAQWCLSMTNERWCYRSSCAKDL